MADRIAQRKIAIFTDPCEREALLLSVARAARKYGTDLLFLNAATDFALTYISEFDEHLRTSGPPIDQAVLAYLNATPQPPLKYAW